MQLSPEQDRALNAIARWRTSDRQTFVMAGYAGTGKTTLLQYFINQQSDLVTCLAPTGKAAAVLQKKLTNARVSTIHRALYKPVPPSTVNLDVLEHQLLMFPDDAELKQAILEEKARLAGADVSFSLKSDRTIINGQLVIVDEASMVTRKMRRDLEATGAKILYVGDPGQLPPVQDEGFFRTHQPDAMLETVQRQALDSPIIRVSMDIRNGKDIYPCHSGPFRKMAKDSVPATIWLEFDQVITGTNDIRRRINRFFRKKRGYDKWYPRAGDKLICLKNDYETGLVHGYMGSAITDINYKADFGEVMGDVVCDGAVMPGYPFIGIPFKRTTMRRPLRNLSTCAKGYRSLILGMPLLFISHRLYTAVTRAKQELLWLF